MATSTMLPIEEILRTALREHDVDGSSSPSFNESSISETAVDSLKSPTSIPFYQPGSTPPLTVTRFRCMLQDTGYPLEVYLPPSEEEGEEDDLALGDGRDVDWSRLKERWVGWAVELPGEQAWSKDSFERSSSLLPEISGLSIASSSRPTPTRPLPPAVHGKFPLPGLSGKYTGALVKIYDPNASFKPGSSYTLTGLLSSSPLPASDDPESASSSISVPCLHILTTPEELTNSFTNCSTESEVPEASRDEVIDYLADQVLGNGDKMAAELLLLGLISSVSGRAPGGMPLGSLSINVLLPKVDGKESNANANTEGQEKTNTARPTAFDVFFQKLQEVLPHVLSLPLTLELLASESFYPSALSPTSNSTTDGLRAGLLQLPPRTTLLINEDTLQSGTLKDQGVKNIKCLAETVRNQKLRYEYPYVSEDFGMEVDLGCIVVGQGKSLLPVDIHLPILPRGSSSASASKVTSYNLPAIRSYLTRAKSSFPTVSIPDSITSYIQNDWVRLRKASASDTQHVNAAVAEDDLARWLRIAKLVAQSHIGDGGREVTEDIWRRTIALDTERKKRMMERS